MNHISIFLILVTITISSCSPQDKSPVKSPNKTITKVHYNQVNCNIAGYIFYLGEEIEEIKKKWPLMEEVVNYSDVTGNSDIADYIQEFTEIYEEHHFYFQFYNDKLIKAELNIPQSELKGRNIEINGNKFLFDTTFSSPTSLTESNYIIECTPFDFDGMKEVKIRIYYNSFWFVVRNLN